MMNELHRKDFCGHTSDLSVLSHFIVRRMFFGNHQMFCNLISSDMELNVNIGKLWWENEGRRKHTSKEDQDTLRFKLQIGFFCREGDNRFGAEFIGKCPPFAVVYQPIPDQALCPEMSVWEGRGMPKQRGTCRRSLCGQASGWPLWRRQVSQARCLLCPASVVALPGPQPCKVSAFLLEPSLKFPLSLVKKWREKLIGLRKRK